MCGNISTTKWTDLEWKEGISVIEHFNRLGEMTLNIFFMTATGILYKTIYENCKPFLYCELFLYIYFIERSKIGVTSRVALLKGKNNIVELYSN